MAKPKKSSRIFKFDKYLILLGIISVLLLTSAARYALRTYQFPQWDEQYYMYMASGYWRLLQDPSTTIINDILKYVPGKQPGYPLLILPFLLVFGLSNAYFWGLITNTLAHIATIFGVYFIAKEYLTKKASFLAAFVFAFYGWVLFHSHLTYSETATSALTAWTIFFLIKSNLLRNRKFSIIFGILFGLTLITRWIALVFVSGPLIYVLVQIIKGQLFKSRKIVINGLLSAVITFAISFYPYFINSYFVSQYFYGHRVGGAMWQLLPQAEKTQFSLHSLTFYINTFNQLGTFYFILIVLGLILAIRKRNMNLILTAIFIPWVFLSFFSILKADRFIIPIYPYLAVLSASVFDYIRNTRIKIALIALTVLLSIGTFLGTDWGKGPMKQSLASINLPFEFGEISKIYLTSISHPPYIYKITGKEIVDYLAKDSKTSGIENPQVLSLFYYRPLDEPIMTRNLYEQKNPITFVNFLGTIISDSKNTDYVVKTAFRSDYVLTKTGLRVDKSFTEENFKLLKAFVKLFDNDIDINKYYEKLNKFWVYQDSSEVTVYKKKVELPSTETERLKLRLSEYLK